jgi:hypothetical protein
VSIANYFETQLLKALKNESPAVATVYAKLHTGDPGEEATSNAAGETTRKSITWAAPSSGVIKNSAALEWTAVSTSETIKYVSLWDASTAGNALWSGALEAEKAVSAGDTLKIAAEGLSVSLD